MSNYTRNTLSGDLAPVNAELEKIETSIADKLDRKPNSGQANQLTAPLDVNSQKLINLAPPVDSADAARLFEINEIKDDIESYVSTGFPIQSGKGGKFLQTDGTATSWEDVSSTEVTNDSVVVGTTGTDALNTLKANSDVQDTRLVTAGADIDALEAATSNINNTSDVDKPISTAQQTALDLKANTSDLGTAAFANLTTSNNDTTAGRVLKVGDFSIGDTTADMASQITYNNAVTQTFTRQATNTYITRRDAGNQTYTLDTPTFLQGDKVYVSRIWNTAEVLTIVAIGAGAAPLIYLPDGTANATQTLEALGTVCLERIGNNSWLARAA